MTEWTTYRRTGVAEARPYMPGEVTDGISIGEVDRANGSPKTGDMIARNPADHKDQWLIEAEYFAKNFEPTAPVPPRESDDAAA